MKKLILTSLLILICYCCCFSQGDGALIGDPSKEAATLEAAKGDTTRALKHLFKRKRNGGTARAIVFGILGAASLVQTVTYEPEYATINQGSSGTQKIEISSPPGPENYLFIVFSGVMTITGVTQAKKFSDDNLQRLLEEFDQGKPLPKPIKLKLKAKDFK
jgi:hypothetical protein